MIKYDKKSSNKNNHSLNQQRADRQEEAVEELFYMLPSHYKQLKKPGERVDVIKHPVSTGRKKKEPDFVILEQGKRPVIVEVKSSMNTTRKVEDIKRKYGNTSYKNKKAKKLVIISFSEVPKKVVEKIERENKQANSLKIELITPFEMQGILEKRQREKKIIEEELKKEQLTEEEKYLKEQRIYAIEGFEKSFILARDIAERNARKAQKIREHNGKKEANRIQISKTKARAGRRFR